MHAQYEEESIYQLLPQQQPVLVRPPMYKSKHAGELVSETSSRRVRPAATMGKPQGQYADHPSAFLHKHSKEPVLPEPTSPSHPKQKVKAPVPLRTDKPLMGLTSNKNYITSNAIEVILAAPGKVPQEEKLYVQKATFGKVPAYLRRNKQTIAMEKQQLEEYIKLREQLDNQPTAAPMSEDERGELLRHLKIKWAAVNVEYQKLGFVMDIDSKIKRREAMERQLAEIEKDIRTLERGDVVLIVPDNGNGYSGCHYDC